MPQAAFVRPPAGEIILTYEDYAALPNDGKRYEIIEGDLFVTPAPIPRHQKAIGNLYLILGLYLQDHPIGELYLAPIDLILSPTNITQPDLLFLTTPKLHLISERGIEGPPDLIVEVLSPTTEKTDRGVKSHLYARFGVTHYWLVDLVAKRLEMFRLSGQRYRALPPVERRDARLKAGYQSCAPTIPDDLFPGLSFRIADLWR